ADADQFAEVVRQADVGTHRCLEIGPAQTQQLCIHECLYSRVSAAAGQDGHFAKRIAALQEGQPLGSAADLQLPATHEIKAVGFVALRDDDLAGPRFARFQL